VGQPARSSHRVAWLVGGGAAAVAAAVVVVLIIVLGGGSSDDGSRDTSATGAGAGEQAVEEPVEPAGPALPGGPYQVETVVTVEHPVWDPAGTTSSGTWTFDLACEEAPCAGSVTLPNGSGTVDFDGSLMRISGTMQLVFDCYSNQTGELVPGSTLTAHVAFSGDLTAAEAAEGERPALAGSLVMNYSTVATTLECEFEEPGSSTHQATLTPA
jgi:hypothetical protein